MRKHFKTRTRNKIVEGRLVKSDRDYYVRYMNRGEVDKNLALQAHVLEILRKQGKPHFIIEKNRAAYEKILDAGNAIVGIFVKDDGPSKKDRLAAHMLVIYPRTDEETTLADPSLLPERNLGKISVVGNVLVHSDFRGNRLMQKLLAEWEKMAAAGGKTHALAEVCADNEFSWGVFLDAGFVIFAAGRDDRDGSDLFYVHKPLKEKFIYSSDPEHNKSLKLSGPDGVFSKAAYNRLSDHLKQGYHAVSYDRDTKTLRLVKCLGSVPLNQPPLPSSEPPRTHAP